MSTGASGLLAHVIMRVDFRTPGVELDASVRAVAERCFRLSLGRFRPRISQLVVTVGEATPGQSLGGVTWQVVVRIQGASRFLLIETDRDLPAAFGRAADRARRCIERDLMRGEWRRSLAAGRAAALLRRPGLGDEPGTPPGQPVNGDLP